VSDDIKTLQDAAKHLLPIYEHLANGGSIDDVQESFRGGEWRAVTWGAITDAGDLLTHGYRYRIKPKPRVWWAILDNDGASVEWCVELSKAEKEFEWWRDCGSCGPYSIVKVQEVV